MCCMRTLLLAATLTLWQSPLLGPLDGEGLAPTDLERIQEGSTAPDFRLQDETARVHQLSQYRGQKTVVLVFFRGHW